MAIFREHINTDDQPRDFGIIIFRRIHRDTRWFHRLSELTQFKTSIPSFNESWLYHRTEIISQLIGVHSSHGCIHRKQPSQPVNPQVGSILSISH